MDNEDLRDDHKSIQRTLGRIEATLEALLRETQESKIALTGALKEHSDHDDERFAAIVARVNGHADQLSTYKGAIRLLGAVAVLFGAAQLWEVVSGALHLGN